MSRSKQINCSSNIYYLELKKRLIIYELKRFFSSKIIIINNYNLIFVQFYSYYS